MRDNLYKARREHQALLKQLQDMYPEERPEDLFDTVEGESSLDAAIAATLRQANENDAHVEGLKWYISHLQARVVRINEQTDRLRQAALQAALEGNIKMPLRAPDFSANVAKGTRKVQVTGDVPDAFCRIKKEPNRTAIADALNAGIRLPFAELSNPVPHWVVRSK